MNIFENEPLSSKVEWPLKNLAKTCTLEQVSVDLRSCGGLKQEFITLFFNVLGCLTSVRVLHLKFAKVATSLRLLELFSSCMVFFIFRL